MPTTSGPLDAECRLLHLPHAIPGPICATCCAGEMTAATLNTVHNLHFYLDTMRRIREAIGFGPSKRSEQEFLDRYFRATP